MLKPKRRSGTLNWPKVPSTKQMDTFYPAGTLVEEIYDLSQIDEVLDDLADGLQIDFWESAAAFWDKVRRKEMNSLTESQQDYLELIQERLEQL